MDVSVSDVANHVDSDVLLPPRKRLLAGLKRQSCSESTSQCSHDKNNKSPNLSPSPSSQPPLTEFDIRLNNLLKSYKNGSNMSPEEIAKAARSAATAAAKAAEAARAAAEEKAAIAAKSVAAAKTALDLVASISDDMGGRNKQQSKNKSKKQVPVQLLYKNCGTGSDPNKRKPKKLKISPSNEKNEIGIGTSVRDGNSKLPLACNDAIETGVDCGRSSEETHSVKMDDKVSKSSKHDEVEVTSREVGSINSKVSKDGCVNSRKRGRIKQKKLPLSLCSFKDQANPEDVNMAPSSGNIKPLEATPTWKCQDFGVPRCIKQDKMVQS